MGLSECQKEDFAYGKILNPAFGDKGHYAFGAADIFAMQMPAIPKLNRIRVRDTYYDAREQAHK